ncbi:DNA-directed RNA polymerase subunit beta [Streptococcus chenjunshii]|uniref:DNA-directed RNA polymerase subunit beta n=1 Tax=Streptococcus chenjunshii TaxID=2173853 RepID=A0A372KLT4_9STRE|nr:DNA-directed RNA polymerase subunit beta [Streptococcus chenjunshii]AXQ78374.1 DNA-directed RNA polymerase subunit beta [Streptococcus chenjunshii]RFU50333.1 DNA-directed RNA polymerase subunit beta [Streptococcus chenjunshii]RFU52538.1 DNA-directed RNA polymerase subunit beta [Streptococcus chenjunshii]
MNSGWKYVLKQLTLILLMAVLCLLCFAVGLMIGYSFMGDGENPLSILSPDKWQSLISKFTGK